MRAAMARTRDWNCLKHVTWTIGREYQALWKPLSLPYPELGGARKLHCLKSGGLEASAVEGLGLSTSPASSSPLGARSYAQGAYKKEPDDGADKVVGAAQSTKAEKSDGLGEEMRVDSWVKHEIEETDGDNVIDKAKQGVKKVGEKVKDTVNYVKPGDSHKEKPSVSGTVSN